MKELTAKNKLFITGILSILFLLFYVVILPHFDVSDLKNNIYLLDIRASYTAEYVRTLFDTIGNDGLQQYKYFLIADFGYMAVYGALASFMLVLIIAKMGKPGQILRFSVYTPALLILADIIENINTFYLIFNADDFTESFVRYSSTVTTTKWLLASIVVAMLLCYAFYAFIRYLIWNFRNN